MGTFAGITVAVLGVLVYDGIRLLVGIRLSDEEEFNGADLSIHKIAATSDD